MGPRLRFAVPASATFPRSRRLTHDLQYQAVYGARVRKASGPLAMFALPNSLPHPRLGLAIGRRVGGAVERNRLKRLLREAFRLSQHDLPLAATGSYDLVINARAHKPLELDEYQALVRDLTSQLHTEWQRRERRRAEKAGEGG
jgi:ribonuclease P protein component